MNILFRVDSSFDIGSGHVMRCLTIAKELRKVKNDITFICRKKNGDLIPLIKKKGFKVIVINKKKDPSDKDKTSENIYKKWLGVSENQDAIDSINQIKNDYFNWLIVDHYSLSIKWENLLRKYSNKLMVIDDLANREHDCDLLLDQNWFENSVDRYKELVPKKTKLILGPKYALLRSEFREMRVKPIIKSKESVKLFVFFGGSDPLSLTSLTIKAINEFNKKELKAVIVIGKNNLEYKKIKKEAGLNKNIKLHIQVDNIASLMANSDFAIGSAGANTWERICLGLPSIIISFAENHKILLKDLIKNNYVNYIGDYKEITVNKIKTSITAEIKMNRDQEISELYSLADGKGVFRVANKIMNYN